MNLLAVIDNSIIYFLLFPRKFSEKDEDPFIFSNLVIEVEQKSILGTYGAILMQSEYERMLIELDLLLSDQIDSYLLDPIEPLFKIKMEKETAALYRWTITLKSGKHRNHDFLVSKTELKRFYEELEIEMTEILPPPFLPN